MTNAELIAQLERRQVLVYRDGRHYVPLFVRRVGTSEADESATVLSALRGVEAAREALIKICEKNRLRDLAVLASNPGQNSAVRDIQQIARDALAALSEVTP